MDGGTALVEKIAEIANLADRHFGVTVALGGAYTEAASVCFSRHHSSPQELSIECDGAKSAASVQWAAPDERTTAAWNNETDATEAGAYAVALATVECERGLVAIMRAETLTGADYYIAPAGSTREDVETSFRLEVSGVDAGDMKAVHARLASKLKQAKRGESDKPAIAAVVGFKQLAVAIAKMD